MNTLLSVKHDYTSPTMDAMRTRSKNQKTKNRKPFQEHKVPFEINSAWKRCFAGREEFNYANI